MTKEEILEGNKLIAQFLGLTIITDEISLFDTNYKPLAKYHESWNDLMPVVEKIESLEFSFYIVGKCCYLNDKPPSMFGESKIQAVYLKVVEFIKWYNEKCSE